MKWPKLTKGQKDYWIRRVIRNLSMKRGRAQRKARDETIKKILKFGPQSSCSIVVTALMRWPKRINNK